MTTKEKFIERFNITVAEIDYQLKKALNNALKSNAIDFDQTEDNFFASDVLIAATLEDMVRNIMKGGLSGQLQIKLRKLSNQYKANPEIWQRNWKN